MRGDAVFEQAAGYREILNAEYTMLVNGVEAVIYIYEDGEYWEVEDIPSFEELLGVDVSITNKELRHHSLQLNLDRCCRYNPLTHIVDITHNGFLTRGRGGAAKRADVIAYIKKRASELVHGDEIHLGRVNYSRLLEWKDPNV